MKIVVAMDSFKGSLTASEACQAVAKGLHGHEVKCLPVSDGGDGFVDTISQYSGYKLETIDISGPLNGHIVKGKIAFSLDRETAIIEAAQACGLIHLTQEQRNPMLTDSRGVGEMLIHAIKRGSKNIVIGLGGSATNDLGMGMLTACGMNFLDKNGTILEPKGENLSKIHTIENCDKLKTLLNGIKLIIASDVSNPLCGPQGCAHVYSRQKGATEQMVNLLENGANSCQQVITAHTGICCQNKPGAGAAGGLGYAFMSFSNCEFRSGSTVCFDLVHIDNILAHTDLVITGEGKSDNQTLMGKIPYSVMKRAAKNAVKTILISGQVINKSALLDAGFLAVAASTPIHQPIEIAMEKEIAIQNLTKQASQVITQISL